MDNIYSSLPPMFRPRKAQDVAQSYTSSKVPDVPKQVPVTKGSYAFPWPDEVEGLGRHRVDAFDHCAKCGVGSWVRYGTTVLCLAHAKGK
jgi:hypothetical protein